MAPSSLSLSKPTSNKRSSTSTTHQSNNANPNSPNCSSLLCRHSPSATLDILILILVLFSVTFLISSYFSYIFKSLSLLLPTLSFSTVWNVLCDTQIVYYTCFSLFFITVLISIEICCGYRSKKCGKVGCKGLKKSMEFDLRLQSEECLRSGAKEVKEIDELPWKGGSEENPDYECLRAELRKMAWPNGRAVLLFMAKCGCPVSKLEGWGPKRRRRHKK
ncbi:unnamed protein product [Ilex paraguariensis]|uniref:Ribosomal protein L34e superfamily protein n=1 Tax=Ilex paraguariensis TaxID=185542 RepID=A0ABC8T469_9AQUA